MGKDPEDVRCDEGRGLLCDVSGGWAFPHRTYVKCCQMFCDKGPKCKRLQPAERKEAFGKNRPRQPALKAFQ